LRGEGLIRQLVAGLLLGIVLVGLLGIVFPVAVVVGPFLARAVLPPRKA
jgi:hypothetical protein